MNSKELKLNLEFEKNYIEFLSRFIASNINSVYTIYNNNHEFNWNNIIALSEDTLILSNEQNNILFRKINDVLKNKYNLILIDKNNLIIKKIK